MTTFETLLPEYESLRTKNQLLHEEALQKAARIFALEKYIENVEEIVRLMQLDQAIGRSRPIGRRFMKVDKDVKLDVGYIHIRKGRVTKTVDLSPGILFDFNKKSEVLGIELLSLERLAPPPVF